MPSPAILRQRPLRGTVFVVMRGQGRGLGLGSLPLQAPSCVILGRDISPVAWTVYRRLADDLQEPRCHLTHCQDVFK